LFDASLFPTIIAARVAATKRTKLNRFIKGDVVLKLKNAGQKKIKKETPIIPKAIHLFFVMLNWFKDFEIQRKP
jgi:carbon monoxide dehydrogenase subunit G